MKIFPGILLFIWFFFSTFKSHSQSSGFPALIALNHQVGFLIDSSEAEKNSLFQHIKRENLFYIVIKQNEPGKFKIIAQYQNDQQFQYDYLSESVRQEWIKIKIGGHDSSVVSDYNVARNYFSEINSWKFFNDSFQLLDYSIPADNKNTFFTLGLGNSIIVANKMATVAGLYLNSHLYWKKWVLSGFYMVGESDLLSPSGDKYKTTIKLKEGGIMLGKVLTKDKVMVSVNAGGSRVRMRTVTHLDTSWYGPDIPDSISTTIQYGMPVAIDFSWPPTSGFGFYMKIQTTLFATKNPLLGINLGMRFGRIKSSKK